MYAGRQEFEYKKRNMTTPILRQCRPKQSYGLSAVTLQNITPTNIKKTLSTSKREGKIIIYLPIRTLTKVAESLPSWFPFCPPLTILSFHIKLDIYYHFVL